MTVPFETTGLEGLRTRRCAIAFADLVESSRVIGEQHAIARWRSFVAKAREQWLPAAGGRFVRTDGDALLMEFDGAASAVRCAFALHEGIAYFNVGLTADQSMHLRIGIHADEVMFDEVEAYGPGATIAKRVTGLAQPGETLVSDAARQQLADGVHADVEDLGHRWFKHADDPVRVFAVRPSGAPPSRTVRLAPRTQDLRPAVAVVPFEAAPGAAAAHDALGHAMADDVIAALARHPGLRVLSRLSTATLRGAALDLQRLRDVLRASFLLTGRYHVFGSQVRLNVELCRLDDGEVLWTATAASTVEALFAGQDDLVPMIVANVGQRVLAHELSRVRSLPMDTLASYTLYLGATGLMNSLLKSDFQRAHEVLEHLAARHPRQAAPLALMARWHVFVAVQGWASDDVAERRQAQNFARRAMDIDPEQPVALVVDGLTRMQADEDADGALQCYEKALRSDPSEALAWSYMTAVHSLRGRHDQAEEAALAAINVSPLDPNRFLFEAYVSMAALGGGRFETAVDHARASVRLHALHAPSHRLLVAALWLAGRQSEARAALPAYLQIRPNARAGPPREAPPGPQGVWWNRFRDALLEAGLPP